MNGLPLLSPLASLLLTPLSLRALNTLMAVSATNQSYLPSFENRRTRRDAIDFGLFVAFFPQLVAGPIMRARDLLPQMEQPRRFSSDAARSGHGRGAGPRRVFHHDPRPSKPHVV